MYNRITEIYKLIIELNNRIKEIYNLILIINTQ